MAENWIKQVAGAALASFDNTCDLLGLSGGKRQGHEYLPLNPMRADSRPGSFSINVDNGAWMDGATGDKGGDLVALAAYVWSCKQSDAARRLAGHFGIEVPAPKNSDGGRASGAAGVSASPEPKKARQASAKRQDEAAEAGPVCMMPVPADAPTPPASHSRHGKPVGRWPYTDAAGAVCFYHDRYEKAGERKQFAPLTLWRSPAGRLQWQFKAPPAPRPILGLADLAARPQAPVVVVEGEKARDAALKLLPAWVPVNWQGGAQAVERSDWAALAGRDVLLWPDADAPGLDCMGKLAALLWPLQPARLRQLDPAAVAFAAGAGADGVPKLAKGPALEEGDDAADLLARHWKPAHVDLLFAQAGVVSDLVPPGSKNSDGGRVSGAAGASTSPEPKKGRQAPAKGQEQAGAEPPARGFVSSAGGVFYLEPEKKPRFVCKPLEVLALVRDPNSEGWGKLVRFADPDGTDKRRIVPDALLSGDGTELERTLRGAGLSVSASGRPLLRQYLIEAKPEQRARVTDRTGWHDTHDGGAVFVVPSGAHGDGGEEWIFQSDAPAVVSNKQRGDLAGWRDEVAARCVGNTRLVFSISMAFASPLLHIAGAESGGFHLRSGSSDGKTTCLRVGASVCGGSDYMQRWRATDNGLEGLAMQHCDAPLFLDELAQLEARAAGEVAYMLANGAGKARGGRTGGMRELGRWRLLFLSAGEIGLAQHMGEAGKQAKAGQELRLAEIPADAGAGLGVFEQLHQAANGSEFAKSLDRAIAKQHGTAWPAFLERLAAERCSLADTLHDAAKAFEARFLSDVAEGQARRVASRFGLVGAAGELATQWGITGWPAGEAMKAAGACFEAWMKNRGGEGNHEERAMLAQVREFLERYAESAFTDWDRPAVDTGNHASVRSDRVGYRRYQKDNDTGEVEFYVFTEAWRARVCKGLDARAVGKLMLARGYIKRGDRDWQGKVRTPEGSPRMVHILPAFLEGED